MGRRMPVIAVGEKPAEGHCHTCGAEARLTWAHIPPECVGNVGNMQPVTSRDPITRQEATTMRAERGFAEGGIRVRQQCAQCNGTLSRYDGALKPFWQAGLYVREIVLGAEGQPPHWPMQFDDIDPGAVIRSLVGALSALASELHDDYPALIQAVLDNRPLAPPADLLIGLGLHAGTSCCATAGYQVFSQPDVALRRVLLRDQVASVAFPPYSFVLRKKAAAADPHFNIGEWLREEAGRTRQVSLLLPVLGDADVEGPLPPDEPTEFVAMKGHPLRPL